MNTMPRATTPPADTLKDLAYSMVSSAWAGLDDGLRGDVIDTLFYGEYLNAIEVMLSATATLDPHVADQAKAALRAQPA